jgi:C1A family cysteine protease
MPDLRDWTSQSAAVRAEQVKLKATEDKPIPSRCDLREWCSPIQDQGSLGSCAAHAGAGIIEYFERRAFGKHFPASRLFLYKTARHLAGLTGDTGAYLRNVMGALVMFGVPHEKWWPYTTGTGWDNEPNEWQYAVAKNYSAIAYFRYDTPGQDVVGNVKLWLAHGVPAMFGFWVFQSFNWGNAPGFIPLPGPNEAALGGHAVVAVGYDDELEIRHLGNNTSTSGAFLFRNSWGTGWGSQGYGWLPYAYVGRNLASDFWSMLSATWIDTGNFGSF